jgi:hypothetical protein
VSDYEWTIEITPAARAAISREIKAQWDGRELGGALVGHTSGDRIVVSNANGIGIGVETPRGETWMRPGRGRWFEFAQACRAELLGDWHLHPGGGSTLPSDADVRSWEATREALRSPMYVGLIFLPRRVVVQGINYSEAAWSFREPEVGEYVITESGNHRTRIVLSGEDRHELRGRPMTQQTLATFLKSFGIRSRTIWLGHGATAKGYLWEQFEPVWARYLDGGTETSGRQADVRPKPAPDATPDGLTAPDEGRHPTRTREEDPPLRVGADRPVRPSGPHQDAASQPSGHPSGQPSGGLPAPAPVPAELPLTEAVLVPAEPPPGAPAHRPLPAPSTDIRPLVVLLRRDSMMSRRMAEAEIGQAVAWRDWTAAHVGYYEEIGRPDLARIARP